MVFKIYNCDIGGFRMDNLKTNKFLAAFLLAGLLAMGGGKIAEILVPDKELAENAYPIEVKEVAAGGHSATSSDKGPEPILALLASADAQSGMKLAKKCTACHEFSMDGKNKTGPMLWNIVDANKGMKDGFKYSEALVGMGGKWDYEALNAFLYKPKAYIKGTKMNFAGLKKPKDRAALIMWLREQGSQSYALPTEADIQAEEARFNPEPEEEEADEEENAEGKSAEDENSEDDEAENGEQPAEEDDEKEV